MPLVALALALVILVPLMIVAIPLSILQRYRMGTVERPARGWIAAINIFALSISASMILVVSAASSFWIPRALPYTLLGMAIGGLLGLLGLALTRWNVQRGQLRYTPNRLLVLFITLVVLGRIAWGFWRGWNAWGTTESASSWLTQAGAAGSMGAGAVVIGYTLVYWIGIRRRTRRGVGDLRI